MAHPNEDRQALENTIQAIRSAYEAQAAVIRAIANPQDAYELATRLRTELDPLLTEAGQLRAQMVRRVWESEPMSLSALGRRIGVSKARADQLIRAAQAKGKATR